MKKLLLTLIAVLVLICTAAAADETIVLYNGTNTIANAWTLGPSCYTINAGGSFDPALFTEGCSITVTYTGTEGAVYLALAQWSDNVWAQADSPAETAAQDGAWVSTFTWEQLLAAYGRADMSDVNAVCVGSAQSSEPITVTRIEWHGAAPQAAEAVNAEAAPVTIFRGSMAGSGVNSWMTCFYTAHAGGTFDAAQMNEGCALQVTYKGPEGGVYLVLGSVSGSKQWAPIRPSSSELNESGTRTDTYPYSVIRGAYGTDFARLDEIIVYCNADSVTLRRVDYIPGTGDPISTDGTWLCGGKGAAVIGDSIAQNAGNFGNWTGILGIADCDNFGIGGQTSRHCAARIAAIADQDYDTLIILVGINDIGAGISSQETVDNDIAMAEAVWAVNPDCRVIAISVLPTTPAFYQGMQHRIAETNSLLIAWAESDERVVYADCYSLFLGEDGYCRPELVSDGLHPNAAGYAVIAEVVKPLLGD